MNRFSGRAGLQDLSEGTSPLSLEDEEFSEIDVNVPEDCASGMHTVNDQVHWPSGSMALDQELKNTEASFKRRAIGLTDVPMSNSSGEDIDQNGYPHGSEVLSFNGAPQNPGLSREQGDDEETDYFGSASDIVDLPPKNEKYKKNYEYSQEADKDNDNDFFKFLGVGLKTTKSYLIHIDDLYLELLKIGNDEEALLLQHILKRADVVCFDDSKDVVERYYHAKNILIKKASKSYVGVDYDSELVNGETSFHFYGEHKKGGSWWYSHNDVDKKIKVSDIVMGEEDSTWLGLDAYQLEPIVRLAKTYNNDLLGGIVYLNRYASDLGIKLDWVDASIAIYLHAYDSFKKVGK